MQSQTTFTLSFWVNATRIKNNLVSVFARVTVNGKRANISLKRKVILSEWIPIKEKQDETSKKTVYLIDISTWLRIELMKLTMN